MSEVNSLISLLEDLEIDDNDVDDDDSMKIETYQSFNEIESQEFSNDEDIKQKLHKLHEQLLNNVYMIINDDPRFTAEIVDNVVILKNKLYSMKLNSNKPVNKVILQLPESCKEKIPSRNDFNLWKENFEVFDSIRDHLMRDSHKKSNKFIEDLYSKNIRNENDNNVADIKKQIITLAIDMIYKMCEPNKVNFNMKLPKMYEIASYLERFYNEYNIGSFYSEKQHFTNKYFIEFSKPILTKLKLTKYNYFLYKNDLNLWKDNINDALLKVIRGAQNILILFGPFGYDALLKNEIFIKQLDLQAIFEFKREELRFFALNNLIDLKLNNKKIHLFNSNDYVNIIFEGATLIN